MMLAQPPNIIKGAKGISDFIVRLFPPLNKVILWLTHIKASVRTAPIQKAITTAEKPHAAPRSSPRERPSLASPKPIARPRDRSHMPPKKRKVIGPASQSSVLESTPMRYMTAIRIEVYTRASGIILCLKSYTVITT
jgi:hypothetical protein